MQSPNDLPPDFSQDHSRGPRAPVIDRREHPRGALPRQLQTWLMVAIALVILLIIYLTGRPDPPAAERAGESSSAAPASVAPDRVRTYQQRLSEQEARLRDELAQARLQEQQPSFAEMPQEDRPPADPLADERRRRDYQSLFADNIALSRRPPTERPYSERQSSEEPMSHLTPASLGLPPGWEAALPPGFPSRPLPANPLAASPAHEPGTSSGEGPTVPAPANKESAEGQTVPQPGDAAAADGTAAATRSRTTGAISPIGPLHTILEGTFIDAVLTNRLDGSFQGSVNCMVTSPVYSHSRQHVLIPTGARLLGTASPVQAWGESRLAVRFHRLIMPDGRTYSLERFTGLNQAGDAGLKDQINRHYLRVFGASLAIGALAGLTQYDTRGVADPGYGFGDAYRQGIGSSLAQSAGRILDRFLNVLPTITIREGHRVKAYITNDLELPAYM